MEMQSENGEGGGGKGSQNLCITPNLERTKSCTQYLETHFGFGILKSN